MAFFTALFVTSLNSILHDSLVSIFNMLAKCQDIASPSLSGSVARYIFSLFLACFLILSKSSPLPLIVMYLGS